MPKETADLLELRLPPDDGAIATALAELESKLSSWSSSAESIHKHLGRRSAQAAELESVLAAQQQQLDRQLEAFKQQREQSIREQAELATLQSSVVATAATGAPETPSFEPPPAPVKTSKQRSEAKRAGDKRTVQADAEKAGTGRDAVLAPSTPSGGPDHEIPARAERDDRITSAESGAAVRQDDDALLESLDTPMANMIRQRYQDHAGRRSIKDLIAEHEKETDEAEALLDSLPTEVAADIRVQFRFYNGRRTIKQLIEEYKAEPGSEKHSWWKRVKG